MVNPQVTMGEKLKFGQLWMKNGVSMGVPFFEETSKWVNVQHLLAFPPEDTS